VHWSLPRAACGPEPQVGNIRYVLPLFFLVSRFEWQNKTNAMGWLLLANTNIPNASPTGLHQFDERLSRVRTQGCAISSELVFCFCFDAHAQMLSIVLFLTVIATL
jgi:hypothetical protein